MATQGPEHSDLPPKTGEMLNHYMDSKRWDVVVHRPGDIIIATVRCILRILCTIVVLFCSEALPPNF